MSMFFSDIGHMHLFFIFSTKKMRDYGTFFPFIFHMSNLSVFCGHYAFVFLHMSIYSNFCGHYSFVFLYMSIFSNFCGHYSFIFCICPFALPQKKSGAFTPDFATYIYNVAALHVPSCKFPLSIPGYQN